jgi:hypothetical protein
MLLQVQSAQEVQGSTIASFAERGYAMMAPLFSIADLTLPLDELAAVGAGSRDLLRKTWCAELARRIRTHPRVAPLLPPDAVAVQCTFFQKSTGQNWLVPMHQDLSIPVRERVVDARLTGWSDKDGTLFVQPPDELLGQLVAVRLHIDACALADGALRVVPGSHTSGRLNVADALGARERFGETPCEVAQGGALVLKPLLLHASSKASGSSRRRVLHFVFGPPSLPCGLAWHTAVE